MRQMLSFLLVALAFALALSPAGTTHAEEPLEGKIEYEFRAADDPPVFDPAKGILVWEGTISGDDISGTMRWWAMDEPIQIGQVLHFTETWEIVDDDGSVLLAGEDAGSTTIRPQGDAVWRSSGTVTEAGEEYEHLIGRPMHEGGQYTFAAPGLPGSGDGWFLIIGGNHSGDDEGCGD